MRRRPGTRSPTASTQCPAPGCSVRRSPRSSSATSAWENQIPTGGNGPPSSWWRVMAGASTTRCRRRCRGTAFRRWNPPRPRAGPGARKTRVIRSAATTFAAAPPACFPITRSPSASRCSSVAAASQRCPRHGSSTSRRAAPEAACRIGQASSRHRPRLPMGKNHSAGTGRDIRSTQVRRSWVDLSQCAALRAVRYCSRSRGIQGGSGRTMTQHSKHRGESSAAPVQCSTVGTFGRSRSRQRTTRRRSRSSRDADSNAPCSHTSPADDHHRGPALTAPSRASGIP